VQTESLLALMALPALLALISRPKIFPDQSDVSQSIVYRVDFALLISVDGSYWCEADLESLSCCQNDAFGFEFESIAWSHQNRKQRTSG
jgi:hypothetical protein